MQLLSSSAGEKDRKKLVSLRLLEGVPHVSSLVDFRPFFFSPSGFDECDGSDAPDGLQAHQLRQGEDDDHAAHRPPIQRRLPSAVLPVSTCNKPCSRQEESEENLLLLFLLFTEHGIVL